MSEIDDLKKMLTSKSKDNNTQRPASDYLSTGITLLNLALTDHPRRGFLKGKYFLIVGDSKSAKTFLSLTCLAEASLNKNFDNYRFIFDDVEGGAMMDIKRFFGTAVARRMESPATDKDGGPLNSYLIEDFFDNIDDAIKLGIPFIYVLDSMDGTTSHAELETAKKSKAARRKGTKPPGTYGDGKPKKNSSGIRQLIRPLSDMGSILIIINQTRANLDYGPAKKSRSGGHALRFYAASEIWSSVIGKLYRTVRGKKRHIGSRCKLRVEKNRSTGREDPVEIIHYHSCGIDDLESNIEFLVEEGHWNKNGSTVSAKDFNFKGTQEKLIKYIEDKNLERKLQSLVGRVWKDIIKKSAVERKRRYE